jgi:hypothetical protein
MPLRRRSASRSWVLTTVLVIILTLACRKLGGNYLDDTYFPMGIGYQWVYLRQNFTITDGTDSVSFDTVTIKVSSAVTTDGWTTYQLEGGYFEDVGEKVVANEDGILAFGGADTVPLVPPEDFKARDDVIGYGLGYRDSVLTISLYSGGGYVLMVYTTDRIKGVGVISQTAELRSPPHYEGYIDRLMYFIRDQDTVWRCDSLDR